MNKHPARGGAALSGGANRSENNRAHGEIEVGAGRDDDGVVAAEFQQAFAETPADGFGDLPAHAR